MKLTTQSAVTTLLAAVVVTAAGAAHADGPAAAPPPPDRMHTELAPGIAFDDNIGTSIAAVRTPLGTVAVQPGTFGVRDAAGNTMLGTPIDTPAATAVGGEPDRHPTSSDIAGQANTAAEPAQSAPGDLMSDINQSVAAAVRSESPPAEHCCR